MASEDNNIHAIPNKARDEVQAAMDDLARNMPKQAVVAKVMVDAYVEAGFTPDQALKLVAYAIFR